MTVLRYLILGGLVIGVSLGVFFVWVRHDSSKPESHEAHTIKVHLRSVDVVTSKEDQERGLSGRRTIPHDYGMLFVFESRENVGFWMKDMLVPIDIVWLDDEGRITGITADVSPSTYPAIFHPPAPVRYVLETRAGEAARKNWRVGTQVVVPEEVQK